MRTDGGGRDDDGKDGDCDAGHFKYMVFFTCKTAPLT